MWTSWERTLNPSANNIQAFFVVLCVVVQHEHYFIIAAGSRHQTVPSIISFLLLACLCPALFQKMACLIMIRFYCQARGRFCIEPYWKICSLVFVKNSSSLFRKKKTELPWNNFFIKFSYRVPTKSDWLRSTSPKVRAWSWRTLRLLFAICSIMLKVKVVLHAVLCASRQEPVNQIKDLATTRLSRSLL